MIKINKNKSVLSYSTINIDQNNSTRNAKFRMMFWNFL